MEPDLDSPMTVSQMARELGASTQKVRNWCAGGAINGAWNIGSKKYQFWRASRREVLAFKQSLSSKPKQQEPESKPRSNYICQHVPAHLRG